MGDMSGFSMFRRLSYMMTSMFGGARDLYKVFGYTTNPEYDQRFIKYLRQDIAARVVDAPAAALWTNPPLVSSNNEEWNQRWDDLIARFNLFSNIERCDKLAGIGRFSLLVIGYNDGGDLSTPVNTRAITQKDTRILYLQPYSERVTKVIKMNDDKRSEDYMKPLMYQIQPMEEFVIGFKGKVSTSGNLLSSFEVHASRVIHIAENCLDNVIYGSPRLERVYNLLDDLLKVTGGAAETYWLTANRGLHIDIDKEMEMDPQDAKDLSAELDEYQHQLRRAIRTRGAKITNLGSNTPDPTGVYKMLISSISGATGIPNRILIGAEAGQLASEQDRANWADRVDERRANWGNPFVLFQLIKKLTKAGYLPSDASLEITVDWPSAFKMSPLENAQTSAQHARSATNFAKAIETMENLKRGEPGSPDQTDPISGKVTPGTPAIEGLDLGELVTVDEARKMMWLDKDPVTFDSGEDVGGDVAPKPKKGSVTTKTSPPRAGKPKRSVVPVKRDHQSLRDYTRRVHISIGRILQF